jgi:hypothetical protein
MGALLAGVDVNRRFRGGCVTGGRLNARRGLRAALRNRRGIGAAAGGPLPSHVLRSMAIDAAGVVEHGVP